MLFENIGFYPTECPAGQRENQCNLVAVAGYFGVKLTPISMSAPIVILTLAVADSIHILLSLRGLLREGYAARLVEIGLYGGSVRGRVDLDGAGTDLGVDAELAVEQQRSIAGFVEMRTV